MSTLGSSGTNLSVNARIGGSTHNGARCTQSLVRVHVSKCTGVCVRAYLVRACLSVSKRVRKSTKRYNNAKQELDLLFKVIANLSLSV